MSCGCGFAVLLRSDGTAVGCGCPDNGVLDIPALPDGLTYAEVAAGARELASPACEIPALVGVLTYTQVSAGTYHAVLLKNNGTAVACGDNEFEQCDIPMLDGSLTYTQIVAGGHHAAVMLMNGGTAVACSSNDSRQCDIQALDGALAYTSALAGLDQTVLSKSNGGAHVFGYNAEGQCDIPLLGGGLTSTASLTKLLILQASHVSSASDFSLCARFQIAEAFHASPRRLDARRRRSLVGQACARALASG
ncbi:unnamed protein product [Prorocentrum cordatum]|uniref:Subtilisin n=1 Tax=Prorocentrum cordatum TaxID=2364126 RepID=A0ABN9Y7E2_9DINO|nr:unnamed protein product [Polarella glacialis]